MLLSIIIVAVRVNALFEVGRSWNCSTMCRICSDSTHTTAGPTGLALALGSRGCRVINGRHCRRVLRVQVVVFWELALLISSVHFFEVSLNRCGAISFKHRWITAKSVLMFFLLWNLWQHARLAWFWTVNIFTPCCLISSIWMIGPTYASASWVPLG